jgi:hypothetical protein
MMKSQQGLRRGRAVAGGALFEALEGRVLMSAAGLASASVPWLTSRDASLGVPVEVTPTPVTDPGGVVTANLSSASGTPLGANLNGESDRVEDHPFTDLVKTTRGFYNLAGRLASNGKTAFANTDSNGWPIEDFGLSLADNAEFGTSIPAGVYHMAFTGPSSVTVAVRRDAPGGAGPVSSTSPLPTLTKLGYNATTKTWTYDINVPAGVRTLALNFRGTAGQVKNLKVLQPGYSLASYPTFTNDYLNLLRTLSPNVLRFMDWAHVNNNTTANWADRPKTTDATMAKVIVPGDLQPAKGIAWEYIIQLANTLHTNVWISVPAHATDDYVRQLATLLKNGLASDLKIYLEYSNEVWNASFEQYRYNRSAAGAEVVAAVKAGRSSDLNYDHLAVDTSKSDGGANAGTWADRRSARRLKQIGDIFKGVWTGAGLANPINNRVLPILCSQGSSLSRFDNMLKYINTVYGPPKNFFYGIGIAPYINLGSLQNTSGLTSAQVLSALSSAVNGYQNGTSLSNAKARANQWGLKLEAYEGGIDTFGSASIAAKAAAVKDPQIQSIMQRYLNVWYSKGGDQINWETIGARSFNSPYGTWSITDDIHNYNEPKELAFKTVRNSGVLGG